MLAQRSELSLEPGIMIPEEFGEHFRRMFPISLFHSDVDWNTKLLLHRSSRITGTSSLKLSLVDLLPPGDDGNALYSDIGVRNLIIINLK